MFLFPLAPCRGEQPPRYRRLNSRRSVPHGWRPKRTRQNWGGESEGAPQPPILRRLPPRIARSRRPASAGAPRPPLRKRRRPRSRRARPRVALRPSPRGRRQRRRQRRRRQRRRRLQQRSQPQPPRLHLCLRLLLLLPPPQRTLARQRPHPQWRRSSLRLRQRHKNQRHLWQRRLQPRCQQHLRPQHPRPRAQAGGMPVRQAGWEGCWQQRRRARRRASQLLRQSLPHGPSSLHPRPSTPALAQLNQLLPQGRNLASQNQAYLSSVRSRTRPSRSRLLRVGSPRL